MTVIAMHLIASFVNRIISAPAVTILSSAELYKKERQASSIIISSSTVMDVIPTEKLSSNQFVALNAFMKDFHQRFNTFKHWPKTHIVTPHAMARAGLYYQNREDYVQCAFCLGSMHNWKQGDNAVEEHRGLPPHCSFFLQMETRYKCLHTNVESVFFPCLHIICCENCAETVNFCLVCGQEVISKLKVCFHNMNHEVADQCDSV